MCAATTDSSFMPIHSWSASSIDCLNLLNANEVEGFTFYVSPSYSRGNQHYLARQAFLRSYQFHLEETFKDKLRRSVQRLSEESLDEILKPTLRKWIRATKVFFNRHFQVVKTNPMTNLWPAACFRPPFVLENKYKNPEGMARFLGL